MPNYVSEELNRVCTAAGVQCTVTMDPRDYQKVYQFSNQGRETVEISYDKFYAYLQPGHVMELRPGQYEVKITRWFVTYR